MSRALALGLVLLAPLACGPLVMIPGGALSGEVAPAPSDWAFSDAVDTVQLETNPADPYSVNVWGVGAGSAFYIGAGDKDSQWARNIRANPQVRLRIDGVLYELSAEEIEDEAELEVFLAAAQKKYDFEPEPDQRESATLFKLTAR
jgi:hypothetical protein